MRNLVQVLLTAGLLAGCAVRLALRQAEYARYVGQSEGALVAELGVPSRTYEVAGVKYLAYADTRQEILDMSPAYPFGPPFWGWYGGGFPAQAVTLTCEATFAVAQGVVRSFVLRGNGCR
jgi:hypothetical protein